MAVEVVATSAPGPITLDDRPQISKVSETKETECMRLNELRHYHEEECVESRSLTRKTRVLTGTEITLIMH